MFFKLAFLSFVVLFEFSKWPHVFAFVGCGNVPTRKGNFSMISTGWKDVVKRGYINRYVTFRCTTNDRHASVSLPYYEYNTRKWRNVRTPSKKYPADSFIQIGQMFVFIKIQGLHQGGLFRCVAEAHGNKICLRLGILSIVRKHENMLNLWPDFTPLKIKEGETLTINCNTEHNCLSSKLKWYKRTKGTDMEIDSSAVTFSDRILHGVKHRLMRFVNITKSDSGTYVCKKHSSFPEERIAESNIHVFVLDKSSKETAWKDKDDS